MAAGQLCEVSVKMIGGIGFEASRSLSTYTRKRRLIPAIP